MYVVKRCRYGLMTYNRRDIWQGRSYEMYGEYSEAEIALLRRVVKPGDYALDIGANIGSLTIPLARFVGDAGAVVAFEPERRAFYALCANVALNNFRNVFCFHQALGTAAGTILVPELDEDRTVNFGGVELDRDYSQCPHYPVHINTIDAISVPKVNFIKIDVEGMERTVLQGGCKKIDEFKPLLYVEDDREAKSAELRQFLHSLGYILYLHCPPFFNPENFYEEKSNVFGDVISKNLFCHHGSTPCPDLSGLNVTLVP